jgi:hypothetical protein
MPFGLGKLADPLHEGERFPEIVESKCALDAAGFIAQLPIRSLALEAQGFITRKGGTPPRQVPVFSARVSVMWLFPIALTNATAGDQRSISPNTMSSEPRIAETSASICPRLRKSIACRWANDGARILHL